jgi:hypothetical protein
MRRRNMLKTVLLAGVAAGGVGLAPGAAWAQQAGNAPASSTDSTPQVAQATPAAAAAPASCTGPVDPYKNYACLDQYLGTSFLDRFINYYRLENGHAAPPTDPNAPPGRIDGWPRTPETAPPMAYTEWPTGALTSIGVTRPNGADSPFMVAIANTGFGQWLADHNTQIYGWIEPGANYSTNQNTPGGNGPIPYTYTPNTVVLDQAVLYFDRWPDTVQTDHFDFGYRISGIYGLDYRYTNSFGVASSQFNGANHVYGYDFPMEYVDLYFPQILKGEEVRIGRYISIPDIEAQLAPNNITFTHSLTYGWDNYTNTGIVFSTQVTKNILVQAGLTDGTETPLWHGGLSEPNLYVQQGLSFTPGVQVPLGTPGAFAMGAGQDPLYSGSYYYKDPGNQPSATFCIRFVWNDGWDTLYPCVDGINNGTWGYNNLQWHGFTYYHKFNDNWHVDFESYFLQEKHVLNARNPDAVYLYANGGTWDSPSNIPNNQSNLAYCGNIQTLDCNVKAVGVLAYWNYTPNPDQSPGQLHAPHGVLLRSKRLAYRHHVTLARLRPRWDICSRIGPLSRYGLVVAALALAAGRDASGNLVVALLQHAGFQRRAEPGDPAGS